MNVLKKIRAVLFGGLWCVVLAVSAIVVLWLVLPSEWTCGLDHDFVEKRLSADLAIEHEIKFVAGKPGRESLLVYRVLDSSFLDRGNSRFSLVKGELARKDYAERVREIMLACGVDAIPSDPQDYYTFRGSDYSVICIRGEASSFLIYLGAQ